MILNDKNILNEIVSLVRSDRALLNKTTEHPLDANIVGRIDRLKEYDNLYKHYDEVYALWVDLIEKSIKCLRYHDEREPFQGKESKKPVVHGMTNLANYFAKYSDFEGLLYGADKYYRDHVFHVFRTWATGVYILLSNEKSMLKKARTDGKELKDLGISNLEIISMWTVAALCHDLGYPLEKARYILAKTKNMTQSIVGDSEIWADLSFSGIQEEINLLILRFMSSKMLVNADIATSEQYCKMRVQPKYYIKLCKSLEKYDHGVLGTIVLAKSLVYFMESEFGVNEDSYFKNGDHKQFYVKREILRAIAFHTCPDIYHMSASSLPFLLILCDEVQNWDRRNWKDHYSGTKNNTTVQFESITPHDIQIIESLKLKSAKEVPEKIKWIKKDYEKLRVILRDGIETSLRDFNFCKTVKMQLRKGNVDVSINIPKDSNARLILSANGLSQTTIKNKILSGVKKFCDIEIMADGNYSIIEKTSK